MNVERKEGGSRTLKEKGQAILDSKWFALATTVVSIAAPCAAGPLTASAGRVLPKVGKLVRFAPALMNGLMNMR